MSTIFRWKEDDIFNLLRSCDKDEVLPFILKYLPIGNRVLESGCGLGRFVKYLQDRGWEAVGIEYSGEATAMVHRTWPELKIIQGDVVYSPFSGETFDGVISLGVVEHWLEGPEKPLRETYRVLRRGGIAIITVPCLNGIRRFKRLIWWKEAGEILRYFLRLIIKGKTGYPFKLNRFQKGYKYVVCPSIGPFHEYNMTPGNFAAEVRNAGFELLEHRALDHIDGLYHELNPFKLLVKFQDWDFRISRPARQFNEFLKAIPFLHCHTQIIVARKPHTEHSN
jgi:SAM-dependent methyltransferase